MPLSGQGDVSSNDRLRCGHPVLAPQRGQQGAAVKVVVVLLPTRRAAQPTRGQCGQRCATQATHSGCSRRRCDRKWHRRRSRHSLQVQGRQGGGAGWGRHSSRQPDKACIPLVHSKVAVLQQPCGGDGHAPPLPPVALSPVAAPPSPPAAAAGKDRNAAWWEQENSAADGMAAPTRVVHPLNTDGQLHHAQPRLTAAAVSPSHDVSTRRRGYHAAHRVGGGVEISTHADGRRQYLRCSTWALGPCGPRAAGGRKQFQHSRRRTPVRCILEGRRGATSAAWRRASGGVCACAGVSTADKGREKSDGDASMHALVGQPPDRGWQVGEAVGLPRRRLRSQPF